MGSCSHTLYATCHRWSSCRPVNKAFVQGHKASLKGSAVPRSFLRMRQAALMTNGKSYWNYSSFSMNIALREVHLFPQETWLQQTKSLLTKDGGKGILLLKRRKDITFKWTGLSDFSNGTRVSENTNAWELESHDHWGKKRKPQLEIHFSALWKSGLWPNNNQKRKQYCAVSNYPVVWDMSADDSFLQRELCSQCGGVSATRTWPVLLCVLIGTLI